jgi:hypothetical protein
MPCTAFSPTLTARDQARYLYDHIPPGLFRTEEDSGSTVAWRIAPEPFALSPATLERIVALGDDLLAFYRALNGLYTRSARGTAPSFIADYLDRGKPEHIVRLARQNRFKADLPGVIRPDLILTDDGYIASELDNVPGGMGFVAAMSHAYCALGIEAIGESDGMVRSFARLCASLAGKEHPTAAIVVSEESGDYRAELAWLAERARALGLGEIHVCSPGDVVFTEDALFIRLGDGREEKIDVLYRNFELYDLLNVPKQELMLYAARHNRVTMTPPAKAQLEEKSSFALFHHPQLAKLWRKELGDAVYGRLLSLFPKTWIVDPRPLPPQASITDLEAVGEPVSDWMQLGALGKGERDYVVKPSGFSHLAWGSRGVRVANDLTKEEWVAALSEALAAFDRTPYILQRFHKGRRVSVQYYDRSNDELRTMEGRVRLCPYYFVLGEGTHLGGILATIAPSDKRLIHGMTDAVMSPCIVKDGGV